MDKLCDWLSHNLPTSDTEVSLVHGDFRIDNLIFHPTEVLIPMISQVSTLIYIGISALYNTDYFKAASQC